uniref:Uncharacterized protein n=1 Tax=Acrobeloides nanus TaxID=290746 RepID=A0A914BZR6_9BILA
MNSKNDLSLRDIDEILKESDEVLRESQAKISKFRKLMNKIEYFEGTNNAKVKHQCYHKKIEHIEPSIAVVNKDDDKNDKESYTIRWVNEHFYDSGMFPFWY